MGNVPQKSANIESDSLACVRTANALLKENRVGEAKRQVEQALELTPNNTAIRRLHKQITLLEKNEPRRSAFEHTEAQQYEFDFWESWMKKDFLSGYNYFEKTRAEGKKLAGWCMNDGGFFVKEKDNWERFAEYLNDKVCLEIGSGPEGALSRWWWVKKRIIIEPLVERFKNFQLENCNKTWFADDIKLYARCAEEFIPELSNAIDGAILCINVLDHCVEPMLALQNIAKYARPGCHLFLWTTLWRSFECDEGHRNITINRTAFERNIIDLGFDVLSSFDKHHDTPEMIGYGCRAIKK